MKPACRCPQHEGIGTTSAAVAVALMPKFGCPICWPLYAAVFGAIGLPLASVNRLLTLMTGLLTISVFLMFVRNPEERAPALLAVASGVMVLASRLFNLPNALCIAGSIGLFIALLWRVIGRVARQRTPAHDRL